jgi:cobalt-zinc-cadmium efflux system protein
MKTEKNIFIAFIINFFFSVFEFVGGVFTGSVAIISDALHDIGDSASIGISFLLERKSRKQPDEKYTYGYARFSVVGSAVTVLILLIGSVFVICNAIIRIVNPSEINYNGMILFAVTGFCINLCAAILTREGESLNQKAVNLHMLEDVLGWLVVLIGAVVMRFTDFYIIDPLMSVGVAIFIFINAAKALKDVLDIFLEKKPDNIDINEIREHIENIEGVNGVHHIHIWSMDGRKNYATMHIVIKGEPISIKREIREELKEHGIVHTTLELEGEDEVCEEERCIVKHGCLAEHNHHHH